MLPTGIRRWSQNFQRWLDGVKSAHRPSQIAFEEYRYAERELERRKERLEAELHALATEGKHAPVVQALQALKVVREITAVTLVAEVGEFSRFRSPAQLMAYAGLVPREYSSGAQTRRGGVTRTGNSHIRFALEEAAWANRFRPGVRVALRWRQEGVAPEVIQIAMKAQQRRSSRTQ